MAARVVDLPLPGGAGDQHQPLGERRRSGATTGGMPSCSRPMILLGMCRNTAPTPPDVAEEVDAEARQAGDRVGEVGVVRGRRTPAGCARAAPGRAGARTASGASGGDVRDLAHVAVDAPARALAAGEVEVRGPLGHHGAEQPLEQRRVGGSGLGPRAGDPGAARPAAGRAGARSGAPAAAPCPAGGRAGARTAPGSARRRGRPSSDWPLHARGTDPEADHEVARQQVEQPALRHQLRRRPRGWGACPTARSRRSARTRASSRPKAGTCSAIRSEEAGLEPDHGRAHRGGHRRRARPAQQHPGDARPPRHGAKRASSIRLGASARRPAGRAARRRARRPAPPGTSPWRISSSPGSSWSSCACPAALRSWSSSSRGTAARAGAPRPPCRGSRPGSPSISWCLLPARGSWTALAPPGRRCPRTRRGTVRGALRVHLSISGHEPHADLERASGRPRCPRTA